MLSRVGTFGPPQSCRSSYTYACKWDIFPKTHKDFVFEKFWLSPNSQWVSVTTLPYFSVLYNSHIYLFQALRMYCIDTKALVFMFNRGSPYGFKFTIHPISTRICIPYKQWKVCASWPSGTLALSMQYILKNDLCTAINPLSFITLYNGCCRWFW